jgi:putative lipoprotein
MNLTNLTLILLALCLASCTNRASTEPAEDRAGADGTGEDRRGQVRVRGTVSYMARIALPPDAVLNVALLDVSRADVAADTLVDRQIPTAGRQVPIPFELSVDATAIRPQNRYVVRATITSGDRLLFTTTQAYPVLTQGAGDEVNLRVEMPDRPGTTAPTAPTDSPDRPLVGTVWRILTIDGQPVQTGDSRREPSLTLTDDNRFSTTAGVNMIGGSWTRDGDKLTIAPGPSTLMAGPEHLMQQERQLTEALASVTGFEVQGDTLTLFAGDKPVLTGHAPKNR